MPHLIMGGMRIQTRALWPPTLLHCLCLLFTAQMMQVFTTLHEVRAEKHEKGLIALGNGAYIREWSSMNA